MPEEKRILFLKEIIKEKLHFEIQRTESHTSFQPIFVPVGNFYPLGGTTPYKLKDRAADRIFNKFLEMVQKLLSVHPLS